MSFAVVGTDTGVGKTVVTAGLVGWLRREGVDARGVKPVQTGEDDDAGYVADACSCEAAAVQLDHVAPPLAPRVAARRVGRRLDYGSIREGCERELEDAQVGVLEGVGGLRVPLAGDREVIDLVADLELPAVLVARPDLGTLNHTALSVTALRRRDVEVSSVVLSGYEGSTVAERTNPDELRRQLSVPVYTLGPVDTDPSGVVDDVASELPGAVFPEAVRERL